jgi:hypothetical protein
MPEMDQSRLATRARRYWRLRRYWRHLPLVRLWFFYVWPDRCMSCKRRWRDHHEECYFA